MTRHAGTPEEFAALLRDDDARYGKFASSTSPRRSANRQWACMFSSEQLLIVAKMSSTDL